MSTEIPDLYRVKYRTKGGRNWSYGIVIRFDDEAKREWESRRLLLIEDAIRPVAHWVRYDETEIVDIPFSYDPKNPDEYDTYVEKEYRKAQEKSDQSDTLKDKMFSVGVADGMAHYVVTKENKKTVKVEWRGFHGDRYRDTVLGLGGTIGKERIEPLVRANEGLKALFPGASK